MRSQLARVLLVLLALSVPASAQELVVLPAVPVIEWTEMPPSVTTFSLPQQTMSEQGIEVLKVFESFSPVAYRDGKGYSIGYGMQTWQGKRVTRRYPGRVSIEEAEVELYRQLPTYERIVREVVVDTIPQEVFDSFVSIAYNLGRINDTIVSKLERSMVLTVTDFLSTARYRGRVNWKLQGRRTREFLMALGEYETAMSAAWTRSQVYLSMQQLKRRQLTWLGDN